MKAVKTPSNFTLGFSDMDFELNYAVIVCQRVTHKMKLSLSVQDPAVPVLAVVNSLVTTYELHKQRLCHVILQRLEFLSDFLYRMTCRRLESSEAVNKNKQAPRYSKPSE